MDTKIKIENLTFKFSKESPFLFQDANAEFETEKINFIQGKNGIGKSTLFRILQGNINKKEIIEGKLSIEDKQYNLNDKKNNEKRITLVHQSFDLMLADQFNFEENIKFAQFQTYPNLNYLPNRIDLTEFIESEIDIYKPVHKLSGGQRQILAILMALQNPKDILMLDEPTANLDTINCNILMNFLKKLQKTSKLTILIICHDKEIIKEYAQDSYFEIKDKKIYKTFL